jgi:putative ABC transport system substrate-binding protein
VVQAFLRSLRDLGLVERQNFLIEYRWADGRIERLPDLAAELVRLKVDLIVAPAGTAALAAKKATSSIPIVMIFPADPVGLGLVASMRRPGGNVTGTSSPESGTIRQAAANLKGDDPSRHAHGHALESCRPGIRHSSEGGGSRRRAMHIRLQRAEAHGPEEFEGALPQ